MKVEIDKNSGFCGGVIQAIETAEKSLDKGCGMSPRGKNLCGTNAGRREGGTAEGKVFSLGDIVHNEQELARLEAKGLGVIKSSELSNFAHFCGNSKAEDVDSGRGNRKSCLGNGKTLLIRAHGEPPSTYVTARAAGFEIVDCTCPVVLKLQKEIRDAAIRCRKDPRGGTVVIFGKQGHPEVLGLLGQTDGNAVVIENPTMLQEAVRDGKIDLHRPVEIFSQTTRSPSEYSDICSRLGEMTARANESAPFGGQGLLLVHNTICTQVSSRYSSLPKFAESHDVIIFVAGKSSSNGKVLCDLCKAANPRTHHISSADELRREWFSEDDSVGVCGATSTPHWLLEQAAEAVRSIFKN